MEALLELPPYPQGNKKVSAECEQRLWGFDQRGEGVMQSAKKEVRVVVLVDRSRIARPFCVKSVFLPGPPSRIYHFAFVCSHTVFSYWWVFSTFNIFYLTSFYILFLFLYFIYFIFYILYILLYIFYLTLF